MNQDVLVNHRQKVVKHVHLFADPGVMSLRFNGARPKFFLILDHGVEAPCFWMGMPPLSLCESSRSQVLMARLSSAVFPVPVSGVLWLLSAKQ